jgi:hypothetical protein
LPFEPPGPLEPVPRRLVVEVPSDGQIAARPRGNRFISTHERLDRYETLAARKPGYQAMYFVIDAGMISSIFGRATSVLSDPVLSGNILAGFVRRS